MTLDSVTPFIGLAVLIGGGALATGYVTLGIIRWNRDRKAADTWTPADWNEQGDA